MICEEAQELITALVDNELSGLERSSIEGHLKGCRRCQAAYQQEVALKREIRRAGTTLSAPPGLREKILSDLRILPERGNAPKRRGRPGLPTKPIFRPAFVLALLALFLVPAVYLMRPKDQSIPLSALQSHKKILAGTLSFVKLGSQDKVKEQLLRAVEGQFAPMGYDLSLMGLQAVGGMVQEVGGRKILVTIYQGEAPSLSCYTFLGTEEDVPEQATLFFDPEKKINFYTFSRGDVNAVFHREGKVMCLLVSTMPMQDLLALARSKAQPS